MLSSLDVLPEAADRSYLVLRLVHGPKAVGSAAIASVSLRDRALARALDSMVGAAIFLALAMGTAPSAGGDGTGPVAVGISGAYVGYWAYEMAAVVIWGTTIGKSLFGLRVARRDSDAMPTVVQAVLRCLLPMVLTLFLLYPLTYLLALVMPDNRGPHDLLARTRVVRASG